MKVVEGPTAACKSLVGVFFHAPVECDLDLAIFIDESHLVANIAESSRTGKIPVG